MTEDSDFKSTSGNGGTASSGNLLLKGERISFRGDASPSTATDEELNSRYATGDIRIVTESARYSLAGILAMLEETVPGENGVREPRYILDPEYQRRHRWNRARKSRLIESFLMNVPVPPVFLYEREFARFEVMDGRQRLTALGDFYSDKLKLVGLEYWPELNGRTHSQLPSKVRDGIDRRYISSIILLKETAGSAEQAAMLKKMVFERLNSGGVLLGSQETRNAVYDGPLNKLCLDLSANAYFRRLWGIPLNPMSGQDSDVADVDNVNDVDESPNPGMRMFEKMEDVELVLRFFAYRQIGSFKVGLNKVSEFLDQFIIGGNRFPESVLTQYRSMFESTVTFLWNVFEHDAFCLIGTEKYRRRTKTVYDPMMYVANSPEVIPHHNSLVAQKAVLRSEVEAMYQKNKDLFAGRRTNFLDTQDRNRCMSEAFAAAITKIKKI